MRTSIPIFRTGPILFSFDGHAALVGWLIAKKLRAKKSAISHIENHAEDIRLSTSDKYAKALGMRIKVHLTVDN